MICHALATGGLIIFMVVIKRMSSCGGWNEQQSEIPRSTLSKVCHSERSEESALVRLGRERQILRAVYPERINCGFFAALRMTCEGLRVTSEGLRMKATFISIVGAGPCPLRMTPRRAGHDSQRTDSRLKDDRQRLTRHDANLMLKRDSPMFTVFAQGRCQRFFTEACRSCFPNHLAITCKMQARQR